MLPYFVLIAAPSLLFLVSRTSERLTIEKKNKATIWSFFIILLLLLMLRSDTVGIDVRSYLSDFRKMCDTEFDRIFEKFDYYEFGFVLLLKFSTMLSTSGQIFLIIVALLSVLPLAKLYSSSEDALLTISIFIIVPNFTMIFSGLRQVIALAFVAIGYKFVKEKKLLLYVITVFIAFLFHQSALIALILYPVYHMNITKIKMLFISPIFVICLLYNERIFEFLLSFSGKYEEIYEYEQTGAGTMIVLFALFLVFSYLVPQKEKLDRETIGLRNILVVATFLQTFALSNNVAMRMNLYFIMFIPLLIPRVISRSSENNSKVYKFIEFIMVTFFIVYYFYNAFSDVDPLWLYPYIALWE